MGKNFDDLTPFDVYGKHDLLSAAQEIALAMKMRAGGIEGKRARDEMIRCNMRLVLSEAHKFSKRTSIEFADLVQAATVGLIVAVDKFDVDRGNRFSTVGTIWIQQALQRIVAAQDTTIAVPGEVRKWAYHHHTHPDLTIQQIADHFEVKPRRIKDALGAAAVVATLDVTQEDSFPLQVQDLQADDPEERALGAVMHELVGELLGTLTDDERQVVEMKFGLNGFGGREHTPKEIAEVTGSTHNAVNRILSNALHTLRDAA